ncbi:MAG: WYL domain-containing protein [Desulfobulbaceae bacterium]|nr:WYL domain-containing protein [Desulfobulbaceae bacterium]
MPPKKDTTTRAIKILGLYSTLIFSGQEYSLTRLATILRCSKQTVLEMIDQIELSHEANIESEIRCGKRWFRAKTPVKRPQVSLDPAAIQHLLLCRDMVWHLLPETLRSELTNTIYRTTVLLQDTDQRPMATKSMATGVTKGKIDYSQSQLHLETILQAISGSKVCKVVYKAPYRDKPAEYHIAPIKIIAYHESLYLKCWLVPDKGEAKPIFDDMRLSIHRIKDVQGTERLFEVVSEAEDQPERSTFGIIEGEEFRVKVKVAPESATYIRERQWSADQKIKEYKNGGLKLEFTATSRPEVISWVLSFGSQLELLEPRNLRDEVRHNLEKMVDAYRG